MAIQVGEKIPDAGAGELRTLDWAIWYVSRYYVEPERIDPARMTLAGLEALEKAVPEVLVEPVAKGKRVRVRVGTAKRDAIRREEVELWRVDFVGIVERDVVANDQDDIGLRGFAAAAK